MRLHRHARHEEDTHGIDLAPMLDFVLNLLIFFIVTAVFVKQAGLIVNRPSGGVSEPAGEATSIPILISAEGQVWVDNREVDVRAVLPNVTRLHAVHPKAGVLVIADSDAQTGVVAQVIDQVRMGGVYNITFSTSN